MADNDKTRTLQDVLVNINKGIRADRRHLLEDIGSQFSDFREYIREYVVNSSDAGATRCRIWATEDGENVTIHIEDNGRGMHKQRVIDFMTLFRSVKDGDAKKAVGQFGVGKASILAIPDLGCVVMRTSTGKEGWQMRIDSFLDDKPVRVRKIIEPPSHGTYFAITFKAQTDIRTELERLGDILHTYVRYLPMTIIIQQYQGGGQGRVGRFRHINASWSMHQERLGRKYAFSLGGKHFEVIVSLQRQGHELYQNKVLVTSKYNLFSHDIGNSLDIPQICLRVDSPDFELPFGRHGLRNEEILDYLAEYMREQVLPDYFGQLYEISQNPEHHEFESVLLSEVEDIACILLRDGHSRGQLWSTIPLFALWGRPRVSMKELAELVHQYGRLYLEDAENIGADYAAFDGPVLAAIQPAGGIKLLKKHFANKLVNLGLKDMVLEQPQGSGQPLGAKELNFEAFLGFKPELAEGMQLGEEGQTSDELFFSASDFNAWVKAFKNNSGFSSEAHQAQQDLEELHWRVNYLVERDGATPCQSQKFMMKGDTVVLNLHHPEVKQLLLLSEKLPVLAGHWALALCLQDGKKILPHLTPAGREDLVQIDARVRSFAPPEKIRRQPEIASRSNMGRKLEEYLRTLATFSGLSSRHL